MTTREDGVAVQGQSRNSGFRFDSRERTMEELLAAGEIMLVCRSGCQGAGEGAGRGLARAEVIGSAREGYYHRGFFGHHVELVRVTS